MKDVLIISGLFLSIMTVLSIIKFILKPKSLCFFGSGETDWHLVASVVGFFGTIVCLIAALFF